MKRSYIIHPFLFAIYPVLFLFSHNITALSASDLLAPLLLVLGSAAMLLLILGLMLHNYKKAGIVVSIIFILLFSYGHAYNTTSGMQIGNFIVGRHLFLLFIWVLLFACAMYFLIQNKSDLRYLTRFLNIVGFVLVLMPLVNISFHKARYVSGKYNIECREEHSLEYEMPLSSEQLPDIYYIILDRYAGESTLELVYGYDNSEFIDYLNKRGFYVAQHSKSNYIKTAHSLASSLNMEYLNCLSDIVGKDSRDLLPLYGMLRDYSVWRFLKDRGYTFIHFGSFWEPTSKNINADENINLHYLSNFSMELWQTTVLYHIGKHYGLYDVRKKQLNRVLYKFAKLCQIPKMPEPTFTFVHMLLPHEPYIFNRDGSYLPDSELNKRTIKEKYLDQLIYTNTLMMGLVDTLISSSGPGPIIVIQSDEGPFPRRYRIEQDDFKWEYASKEELEEKMNILNAYYLPDVGYDLLYPYITPVNSFRLIFSLYFNIELELLPDEYFAIVDNNHPYNFLSVTDKLK